MKKILFLLMMINILLAKDISILLDWKYQFEFAGYIAAKEKGFYKDAGINVKLVEYNNSNIVNDVLNKKYDFGIYDNNLIDSKIKGKPVKLVSSIFKKGGLILIVKNNINTLQDLENKTIMLSKKDIPTFYNFFKYNGINISKIHFITDYNLTKFMNDKNIVAISAFIANEVYTLAQKGMSFKIVNPSDYNFLLYQGELFSSSDFVDKNPVLVSKFKKATIKGWKYALAHKKEIIDIIYKKYNTQHKSKDAYIYEANKIEKIISPYLYPIGYINKPLLESQFIEESRKLHKKIDSAELVDEYVFDFQNPLNLNEKYLWLIKLYNFYLKYTYAIIIFLISVIIILIILYFYTKIQKQKEKIETLFNQAPIAYILMDLDSKAIKRVNEYTYKLFKYPNNKEFDFKSEKFFVSEDDFNKLKKLIKKYIEENGTIEGFSINWQLNTYDKTPIWVNIKALMYSDKEVLWVMSDINEIMKAQEELDRQMKETKRAMKVKEEFLANMSHEIRTPLNAILGFVDIIYKRETDKENKKYLEIISKSGQNLLTIINDILDFSKIESGKLHIEKIEFNPKEEFESIIYLFESKAKEKNIKLHINFTNLKWNIISDPIRIKQVISNFISNAIKFTPENKNIYCNINYNYQTERLYVEVIDEGIGISKDKLKTIFEPFSQADSSTTRKYGGTGLGLTISKKLVELLGGQLKVESIEGEGSKFIFIIPAKPTTKIENNTKIIPKTEEEIKFKGKILVVEDNKANQLFLQIILKSLGIEDLDLASDGVKAIEKVKENSYDIIFMDENMPNMNGIEATKKIKSMGIITPIIAVTANALSGDKEKFLETMDDYLSKPIKKEELIEILKKYLKEKND